MLRSMTGKKRITHGFDKGYAFYSRQVTSDVREFIADPQGGVWIGQIRIKMVNKDKSYMNSPTTKPSQQF